LIATFRVYLKRRAGRGVGDFFVVQFYRTKEQMRNAARIRVRADGLSAGSFAHTLGFCLWYTKLRRRKDRLVRQRECGTVYLCSVAGGAGVVAHEMTHAAYAWLCGRKGWRPRWKDKALDEDIAWTVGWLVTQYWREYWKRFAK